MPKRRSDRGSVQLCENHGSLRLAFTFKGKRCFISLGLRAKDPTHKHLASGRLVVMAQHLQFGLFSLDKLDYYKTQLYGIDAPMFSQPEVKAPPLSELWQQYSQVNRSGKSGNTIREYGWVKGHIKRLPTDDLEQRQTILDAIAQLRPNTQKKLLGYFSSCVNWGVSSNLLTENPFEGLAKKVRIPKASNDKSDVRPFTAAERDQIIQAFKNHPDYSHYTNLVLFLFFTGCRPNEALPLQWKQVKPEYILFDQTLVNDGSSWQIKESLKTQVSRQFPLNDQLKAILQGMKRGKSDDLVFPSPKGKHIDWNNFRNRAWSKVLETLPEIGYRNPYQTRHTFITLCLETEKINIGNLARYVGTSTTMILQTYAGWIQRQEIPSL